MDISELLKATQTTRLAVLALDRNDPARVDALVVWGQAMRAYHVALLGRAPLCQFDPFEADRTDRTGVLL